MPSSTPSMVPVDRTFLARGYGSMTGEAGAFAGAESVEATFLARGYPWHSDRSGGAPDQYPTDQSLRDIYIGSANRARLDDVSTPVVLPTEEIPDMILGATISSITSGNTLYMGTFEDATEARVSIPVPAGTVVELNVRATSAPGTGESYTYTVYKNGVSQSMTVAVENSAQGATTSANSVSCSTGDRVSIQVTTSAGAATAYHRFSLRYNITA